ncbi:MAG: OmpA family protein [Spirochaetes bacterium]|nr:OmpA family protein [Spirochaetota bacterium]
MKPKSVAVALCFAALAAASAQDAALVFTGTGRYKLVERSDLSKYADGAYVGHVYRETRALIEGKPAPGGVRFEGGFLVFEETLRDMSLASRRIEAEVAADFTIGTNGWITLAVDNGYPSLRGFPAFPADRVAPGARWQAESVRAVDPLNSGVMTRMPVVAEYEYRGIQDYRGVSVHAVRAKYATRYRQGQDRSGDPGLTQASGTHEVDILIIAETGAPVLSRDRLDETFTYASGKTVRFKGFTLSFFETVAPLDDGGMIHDFRRAFADPNPAAPAGPAVASASGLPGNGSTPPADAGPAAARPTGAPPVDAKPEDDLRAAGAEGYLGDESAPELELGSGVSARRTEEGVMLTINDVRFVPDQDAVLPEETWRLDALAAVLGKIPDRGFLVAGHTASVGLPEHEMDLSIRRAKRIVDELVKRGIPASRFVYRGYGSAKPVAPNDTETNKARNRRVEITILED